MSTQQEERTEKVGRSGARSSNRRPGPAWLAVAGIVGPILFTVAFIVQGLFRLQEYSPISETVSALEAGPNGWIQQVNFVVFGILTLAFAVGLHRGTRPSQAGIAGPTILALSAVGLVLAAVFPLAEDASGATFDPAGHMVAGLTYFLSSAVGLVVLSRRLARDPAWWSVSNYALVAGLAALLGFVATGVLVQPDAAPLHEWGGLAQRVLILGVLFPCTIVLAMRLLRVTKEVGR